MEVALFAVLKEQRVWAVEAHGGTVSGDELAGRTPAEKIIGAKPAGAKYLGVGGRKRLGIMEAGVDYFDSGATNAFGIGMIEGIFSAKVVE